MLLALWKSLGSLREEASERAWVLRVAHNVAASHVARAVRDRRHDDALGSERAVDAPDRGAEAWELMRRLRLMDLASQQLVLLHVEGLTSQEIAEATGLSASNVTTRLSRIRKRLAREEEG
jgi:RNA polymerase sigma-70 factor (ECF subfamily)